MKQEAELRKKIKDGQIKDYQSKDQQEKDASIFIQKRLRGILARKRVEEVRQDEMIFLGMARKPKVNDGKPDPIEQMNDTKEHRKLIQKNFMEEYDNAKEELKEEI